MATPEENLSRFQEIANRGLEARLAPNDKLRFDEAMRRGLITMPGSPQQLQQEQADSFQFNERPFSEQLIGTGEMLLSLVTGAVTEPVAGIAGIVEGVSSFVSGDDAPLLRASERVQAVRRGGTRTPRTEAGRESMQAVAAPIEFFFNRVVSPIAETIGDVTKSPVAATIAQTAMETFPPGMRPRPGALVQRRQGRQRMAQMQETTGVDVGARPNVQGRQIAEAAEAQTGGQVARAQNFDLIQQELTTARELARTNVDNLYAIARDTKAAIPVAQMGTLNTNVIESMRNVDLIDKPNLQRRLTELESITQLPDTASVKLNALSDYRARLTKNRGSNPSENAALGVVKGQVDSFLDSMFNADMISGDPAAIQRWKDAREAFSGYKKNFDDNKVIQQLSTQQATPEQIKQWILGTSAVGAKKQAGSVVDQIGDLIGRDSPGFSAIRQETLFDILQPLLQENPNFPGFVKNYDTFVRNNPTLSKSLFPESVTPMRELRDLVSSTSKIQSPRFQFNLTQAIVRTYFGHALSKGQARMSAFMAGMEFIKNSASRSRASKVTADLLGYDPNVNVMPVLPLGSVGALQTLGEPAQQVQQELLDQQMRAIQ